MTTLLDPITVGDLPLPNRVVMAPMTRARANDADEPTDIVVEYYRQRASAGLIVSEGVFPSIEGKGYFATPGIATEAQIAAWRRVTDAVHAAGGRIFLQMMHCGRVGHALNKPGIDHVAPSAVGADFPILTRDAGLQPMSMPRALETDEVEVMIDRFEQGAVNARAAGFDGVELHAASGYLPNQFLASNTNLRADKFGGSPEKRCRFVIDVMERLAKVYGPQRSAIKLAPGIAYNDIQDETVDATYTHLLAHMQGMGLAYLHFQTTLNYESLNAPRPIATPDRIDDLLDVYPYRFMRDRFSGPLMAAGDLTAALCDALLERGAADLFVFGRPYIANPDLVERFAARAELGEPDRATFYGGGAEGLIDYPTLRQARA